MKLKKIIKDSWNNPIKNKDFSKKDFMSFNQKRYKTISLRLYLSTILSFCLVLAITIFSFTYKPIINDAPLNNNTTERLPKPNSQFNISFGNIEADHPKLTNEHLSQLEFADYDMLSLSKNFCDWFNSLNLSRANVSYKSIILNDYIANLQPIRLTQLNDKYSIYFSEQNFVIICYKDYFIFYDLLNANKLLEHFFQN